MSRVCKLYASNILKTKVIMYRFNKNGVSVLAIIDKRYQKDFGGYPVKIEVIYKRTQKYYPTGYDARIEEWETMWKQRKPSKKRMEIIKCFNSIRETVERVSEKGDFSFKRLDLQIGRKTESLKSIADKKYTDLMNKGKVNSYYRYRSTVNAVVRYAGEEITLSEIDSEWLRKCEEFWVKEGLCCTTVNIYMKTLRCIYNEEIQNGSINADRYPFGKGGYRIPQGRKRTSALTKEQIMAVINWKGDSRIEYWRDLWVFSYLCNGINFRDMLYLKYRNISEDEILFIRAKTKSMGNARIIRASVTPLMYGIMQRSGNGRTGKTDDFIFKHAGKDDTPVGVTNVVRSAIRSCNAAMKVISEELGLPHFTTYSARHSFATVLKRNGVDIQFISESLGHTNLLITEHYLAGFDRDDRIRNSLILTD